MILAGLALLGGALYGLGAPRGYVRKPKASGPTDEDVKAFWAAAREDVKASTEAARKGAHLPAWQTPQQRREARQEARDKAFWETIRAENAPPPPKLVYPEWAQQTPGDRRLFDFIQAAIAKRERELETLPNDPSNFSRRKALVDSIWSAHSHLEERKLAYEMEKRLAQRRGMRR